MYAVVYHGPGNKAWEEVPKPTIVDDTDAIVRVDAVTICGTDLHILKGDVPAVTAGPDPRPRGGRHGRSGRRRRQDTSRSATGCWSRASPSCGTCRFCREGSYGQCLGGGGWILGHKIDGTQAEYVRVPFADTSTYLAPAGVSDEQLLMLADILPTGYEVGVLNGHVATRRRRRRRRRRPDRAVGDHGRPALQPQPHRRHRPRRQPARSGQAVRRRRRRSTTAARIRWPSFASSPTDSAPTSRSRRSACRRPSSWPPSSIRPGGHVANIGVHGEPATLHLEELWIKNVTITTGLVDTYSTPTLLRLAQGHQVDAGRFVTHHFAPRPVRGGVRRLRPGRRDRRAEGGAHPDLTRPDGGTCVDKTLQAWTSTRIDEP